MNKTFTLKFFTSFSKVLLVTVILLLSAAMQSASAKPPTAIVTNSGGIQVKTIKCYPNPAVSFVNFDFPADYLQKIIHYKFLVLLVKKCYEMNINVAKSTITFTNDFYRGIYIYQVRDKDGRIMETGKFQVNR